MANGISIPVWIGAVIERDHSRFPVSDPEFRRNVCTSERPRKYKANSVNLESRSRFHSLLRSSCGLSACAQNDASWTGPSHRAAELDYDDSYRAIGPLV